MDEQEHEVHIEIEFASETDLNELMNNVVNSLDNSAVDSEENMAPVLDLSRMNPHFPRRNERVQVQYYYAQERLLPRSCAVSFMSTFLVVTLLVDVLYNGYLRATLNEEIMKIAKHPNWNIESIFLVFQSSLGLGVTCFLYVNILSKTKMLDTLFLSCLTLSSAVVVSNIAWIISEQGDKRHWYILAALAVDDSLLLEATKTHEKVLLVLQLKVFETFLMCFMNLIWLRQWHEQEELCMMVRHRNEPGSDSTAPESSESLSNCGQPEQNPTTSHHPARSPAKGSQNSTEDQPPPPATGFGSSHPKSGDFNTENEMNVSKSAQKEFREKGDGTDIDTALPRLII